jgi:hypothetical protein
MRVVRILAGTALTLVIGVGMAPAALAGETPVPAGGKPMPAAVTADGGKPMPAAVTADGGKPMPAATTDGGKPMPL